MRKLNTIILLVMTLVLSTNVYADDLSVKDNSFETGSNAVFSSSEVKELNELIKNNNFNSQVWIQDLETGCAYIYNPDKLYYSASIIKAPYSIWLCRQADRGEIDLSSNIKNFSSLSGSSRYLSKYANDSTINTWECIDAMIYASDNKATALLSRTWPADYGDSFNEFLHSELLWGEDSKGQLKSDKTNGYLTATDAANTLKYLYNYFNEQGTNGPRLREAYTSAVHDFLYFPEKVTVAKKYGSWKNAFHDIAIVYAEHPYIIVCMTDSGEIGNFPYATTEFMHKLGEMAYEFTQNNRKPSDDTLHKKLHSLLLWEIPQSLLHNNELPDLAFISEYIVYAPDKAYECV